MGNRSVADTIVLPLTIGVEAANSHSFVPRIWQRHGSWVVSASPLSGSAHRLLWPRWAPSGSDRSVTDTRGHRAGPRGSILSQDRSDRWPDRPDLGPKSLPPRNFRIEATTEVNCRSIHSPHDGVARRRRGTRRSRRRIGWSKPSAFASIAVTIRPGTERNGRHRGTQSTVRRRGVRSRGIRTPGRTRLRNGRGPLGRSVSAVAGT